MNELIQVHGPDVARELVEREVTASLVGMVAAVILLVASVYVCIWQRRVYLRDTYHDGHLIASIVAGVLCLVWLICGLSDLFDYIYPAAAVVHDLVPK